MIARYTRPAMGKIWSDENKYRQWLNVELAASEALSEHGHIPAEAAKALRDHADFSVDRINEIEKEVRHDVIAFTTAVAETMKAKGVGEASRWLHFGLTSNDVVDTAQALQIKESAELILAAVQGLEDALKLRAFEFKDAIAIGRTHGVHAEPITFGLKLALYYDECRRSRVRLVAAAEDLRVGKLSGAVGTLGHITAGDEEAICAKLGLAAAPIASQVISRDRHAAFVSALALVCALCEKIALEVRHLQRTEVREAEEPFAEGQTGSSAMPHKRNPELCERICGLARVVRANSLTALENIALWHERDISHSSTERIIFPDSCILLDYMLAMLTDIVRGLLVYPENIARNLEMTQGLVFSQKVMLALIETGLPREEAYKIVQRNSMRSWKDRTPLRTLLEADSDLTARLDAAALDAIFDYRAYTKHVDDSFRRLGLL